MYGRTSDDIAQTLMNMQEEAKVLCRYNQTEMVRTMAQWMSQDRRFDRIPDKAELARESLDARASGRVIRLDSHMI